MSLKTSCNGCGAIVVSSPCDVCKTRINNRRRSQQTRQQRGYDNEYDRNRKLMIEHTWLFKLPCVICGLGFERKQDISAEHVIPLRSGKRDNSRANVQPAHKSCNYGWAKKLCDRLSYDAAKCTAVKCLHC